MDFDKGQFPGAAETTEFLREKSEKKHHLVLLHVVELEILVMFVTFKKQNDIPCVALFCRGEYRSILK